MYLGCPSCFPAARLLALLLLICTIEKSETMNLEYMLGPVDNCRIAQRSKLCEKIELGSTLLIAFRSREHTEMCRCPILQQLVVWPSLGLVSDFNGQNK